MCKAGKEEIVGLLTALELFVAEGDATRHARWLADANRVMQALGGNLPAEVGLAGADSTDDVPTVALRFPRSSEANALALVRALLQHTPAIHVDASFSDRGIVTVNPIALRPGEADVVGHAVRRALGG
jgi:L-seryl-tRNA(Ser) seleniumtransferase